MKFPEYSAEIQGRPPIAGFLKLFARLEMGVASKLDAKSWDSTIAELSHMYTKGNHARYRSHLRHLPRGETVPPLHEPMLEMMKFVRNPNQLKRMQEKLHNRTMQQLSRSLDNYHGTKLIQDKEKRLGKRGELWGDILEYTTIGLLTRYAHPWVLVSPSLPHHESDPRKNPLHYDVALAVSSAEGDESFYLQVKSRCTGRCCAGDNRNGSYYDDRVQFISGCCDLGMTQENAWDDTLPRLLLAEFNGTATEETIRQLDVISDNLLFNISADLLPRGKYSGAIAEAS